MHASFMTVVAACLTFLALIDALPSGKTCKPLPSDASWPDSAAWSTLNSTVSGRLLATVPPGAVCHPGWAQFDTQTCASLTQAWTNGSFHYANPFSIDYNDDTCPPSANTTCSVSGYPAYVVQAGCPEDVQAAINFARDTGVRLAIKATAHDFTGRSSGAGSLSIHTVQMRGLSLNLSDARATSAGGIGSLKISAGETFGDIYKFAADHNVITMGGADSGVGIGGWVMSGGHGPLTAKYGLGADQVLEMEVVTADGVLRTVDANTDSDLFWALRGGGGSTFAALISVTMKVYPSVPIAQYFFAYNTTADSAAYWTMTTFFHTQLANLSEAGVMGYYYMFPSAADERNATIRGKLMGEWIAPNMSAEQLQALIKPLEDKLVAQAASKQQDEVFISGGATSWPDFSFWAVENTVQAVGFDGRLGSRLLGRDALEGNTTRLEAALRRAPSADNYLLGHLVTGPGVKSPPGGIPGGSNGVLPAWRDAYVHFVTTATWPTQDEARKLVATRRLRDEQGAALRELAPDGGSYRNEADPTDHDWQRSFHGANYAQLLAIKRKWDSRGVFWCKSCVGSELWDVQPLDDNLTGMGPDEASLEAGVGQSLVRLCRKEE